MQIPFTVGKYSGYLLSVDYTEPHEHFHVMVNGFYKGQLFRVKGLWVLPDSELKEYAQTLGEVVEAWYS